MVQPEIEKKLRSLSEEYIYNEGLGNILLLSISAADRIAGDSSKIEFDIPQEYIQIREEADKYITDLEDLLSDSDSRFSALNNVIDMKKELVSLYSNVYDYYSQWNTLSLAINDETAIRKYKEQHLANKKVEYDMFYTDCINFLTASDGIEQLRTFTAQLLKCMPMRMARAKYFDLVLRSLRNAFIDATEDSITKSIEAFKRGCAPTLDKNYGKAFPEIKEWLESKYEVNPSKLNDEELAEEYEDFNLMLDTIQGIEDFFTELYDDLNSLIIVLYLNFTFEDLTQDDLAYSDLYHAVCDIMTEDISTQEAESMLETIKDQLETAFEPIIDKINAINEKEIELIDKIGTISVLSEDTQKSISAEGFIRGIYYSNINDELFDFDVEEHSPIASKDFAEKVFSEFIEYMQNYYKDIPMHIRKSNMLMLLGSIPVSMDIPDTMDYIKSSINNCLDIEQRLLIIDKSGMVFASNGFSYADENDEHNEDDCSCGHDHHHDHDCSCGHDHHHDHDCSCGHDHH